MKYLLHYLLCLLLLGAGILFLMQPESSPRLATACIFASVVLFGFLVLFIKPRDKEQERLQRERDQQAAEARKAKEAHATLHEEHSELKQRRFNITELRNILDLGLIEVDTHFSRNWNLPLPHPKTKLRFCGSLRVDLVARYGIDLKKVRFLYNEAANLLLVANAQPQFLSFKKRDTTWQMAEILEYKDPIIGENHWRTSSDWDRLLGETKDRLRKEVEQQTENGPQELSWVIAPLRKQIENSLEAIFGKSGCRVQVVNDTDESFRSLG